MKSNIYIIIFALFFVSCKTPHPYGDACDKIIKTFAKVARDEYRLRLWGQGGGCQDGVNTLFFHFVSDELVDVNQARRLYLRTLDRLLGLINSDESLRPFLKHYPFTNRDIDLSISFFVNGILNNEPEPPNIVYVSGANNLIIYSLKDIEPFSSDSIPSESIQKARGIVEHQDNLMQIPEDCGWVR